MLKRVHCLVALSVAFMSGQVFADGVSVCPQRLHCDTCGCGIPKGFDHWKADASYGKPVGTINFYGSVYTKFRGDVTITCLYGSKSGPRLYRYHANQYEPLRVEKKTLWGNPIGNVRYNCVAAFVKHCSFISK